jgi:hypothetical protein
MGSAIIQIAINHTIVKKRIRKIQNIVIKMMEKHRFENDFIQHIEEIFKTKYNFEDNLENLHDLLETNKITQQDKEYHTQIQTWETDRHSRFIKDFHEYVDTVKSFESTYKQFITRTKQPGSQIWT